MWDAVVGVVFGVLSYWFGFNHPTWPWLGHSLCAAAALTETVRLVIGLRSRKPAAAKSKHHTKRAKASSRGGRAVEAVAFTGACAAAYFFLAVLLGAPATAVREETLTLACLLALLTGAPLCAHGGADAAARALTGTLRAGDADAAFAGVRRTAMVTLFGAWCGSAALPLDWERPWQLWPVPCYLGAVAGYAASNAFSLLSLFSPGLPTIDF